VARRRRRALFCIPSLRTVPGKPRRSTPALGVRDRRRSAQRAVGGSTVRRRWPCFPCREFARNVDFTVIAIRNDVDVDVARNYTPCMPCMNSARLRSLLASVAVPLAIGSISAGAMAAAEGGLYLAGDGSTFVRAAEQALAENSKGQRFFMLVLRAEAAALTKAASKRVVTLRGRVVTAGGVFLVCQRDIDNGSINRAKLVVTTVAVRGFPPPGSNALPPGERYFPDENPDNLPRSNESLLRLRSTCS
jgi:hypothetical protein